MTTTLDIHPCFMLPKEEHNNRRVTEKNVWEALLYCVALLVGNISL